MNFTSILSRFSVHLYVSTGTPLSRKLFNDGLSGVSAKSIDEDVLLAVVANMSYSIIFGSVAGMYWNLTLKQAIALALCKEAGKIAITVATEWTRDTTFYQERQWTAIFSGFAFLQHYKVQSSAFAAFGLSAAIEFTSYMIMSVFNNAILTLPFYKPIDHDPSFSHRYYRTENYRGWFFFHPS